MSEQQALLKLLVGTKVVNIHFDPDQRTLFIAFRGEQQGYSLDVWCINPRTGLVAREEAQLDWVLNCESTQGVIASIQSAATGNAQGDIGIGGDISLETDASLQPLLDTLLQEAFPGALVTYRGEIPAPPGARRELDHLEVGEALQTAYAGMLGYFTITGGLRPNWEALRYLVSSVKRKYSRSEALRPTRLTIKRTVGASGSALEEIDLVTAQPELVIKVVEEWIQSQASKS